MTKLFQKTVIFFSLSCFSVFISCGTDPENEFTPVLDEEIDPEILAAFMNKADSISCPGCIDCNNYPGGDLNGDNILSVINKQGSLHQLRKSATPRALLNISAVHMMPGRDGEANQNAIQSFLELAQAAKDEARLNYKLRSAYRSFQTQCYTFNYKVQQKGYNEATRVSAHPGRSEHQLGNALDITTASLNYNLVSSMGDKEEGIWLEENAYRFGFGLSYPRNQERFTGYVYEPWHWRYIGREAAIELQNSGLMLLEYLLACEENDPSLTCPKEEIIETEPNLGFIGGLCNVDTDCFQLGAEAHCLKKDDGYPSGYCTKSCTSTCPDLAGRNSRTFCVASSPTDASGYCHSQCDTQLYSDNEGCREGYECSSVTRPNQGKTSTACLPTSWTPEPECQNECLQPGDTECASSKTFRECGNFDPDPCLEWSAQQTCQNNNVCETDKCTTPAETCNDECQQSASECLDEYLLQECGQADEDPCLEWEEGFICQSGCQNGKCKISSPELGILRGVVYLMIDSNPDDTSIRMPNAEVIILNKNQLVALDEAASFFMELSTGEYTLQTSHFGYNINSTTCTVKANTTTYCPIAISQ